MGPRNRRRHSRFISARNTFEVLEPRALLSATAGNPSGRPITAGDGSGSASVFLAVSANDIDFGTSATFVAHVIPGGITPANGLLVDFVDAQPSGNVVIATETVANNLASFTWNSGLVGTHHITAQIEAGQSIAIAESVSQDLTISKSATVTALSQGNNGVTATVTTNGVAATGGTVSFFEGTKVLATLTLTADGTAAFSTSGLRAGTHPIVAAYNGSSELLPSTSGVFAVTIAGAQAQHPTIRHGRGRGIAVFDTAVDRFKLIR